MATTGYDNSELKGLSAAEKLAEAQAVQHNLIVRMGAVSSTTVEGKSIARQLNMLADYIKELKIAVAEECACTPLQADIVLRGI